MNKSYRSIYLVEETRKKILTAAHQLFISHGLFETQMKDVAKAACVSKGSLYRYFLDKDDLVFAVLEKVVLSHQNNPECDALMDMHEPGVRLVEEFLRAVWLNDRFENEYRFFAEFDAYFTGVRITATVIERLQAIYHNKYGELFINIIRQGQEDGSINRDLNPHLIMVTLINSVRGLYQRLILRGPGLIEVSMAEQERMIDELLGYCMKGIAAAKHEET
jgi:AcrR family transcriptional regulator